jgi:hypothetical protein
VLALWDVGDDNSSTSFTNVPIRPLGAVGLWNTVVFAHQAANEDEDTKGEEDAERELCFYENRSRRPAACSVLPREQEMARVSSEIEENARVFN